jgi:hypothetical protein
MIEPEPMKRPALCETCGLGGHRAACRYFPVPCEDRQGIYDDGRDDLASAVLTALEVTRHEGMSAEDRARVAEEAIERVMAVCGRVT